MMSGSGTLCPQLVSHIQSGQKYNNPLMQICSHLVPKNQDGGGHNAKPEAAKVKLKPTGDIMLGLRRRRILMQEKPASESW